MDHNLFSLLNLQTFRIMNGSSYVANFLASLIISPLGHEKLIFCFSGTAAFVFRPPLQIVYPKMVPICLSNRSCFRYRGIIFNSSAYLLQV